MHAAATSGPGALPDHMPPPAINRAVLDLYRASRETAPGRFQEHALTIVETLLPFDSAWWGMSSPLQVQRPYLHRCDARIFQDYVAHMAQDLLREALVARPGTTIDLDALVGRARYLRTPLYRAFGRKWAMERVLGTLQVEPVSGLYESIVLWRHDARRPFTEDERRTKEWLAPHLAQAHRIGRLLHVLGESPSAPRAWALVDEYGHVREVSPAFVPLLRKEWPRWRGERLPESLPSLAQLRAGRAWVGDSIASSASARGAYVLVVARHASPIHRLGAREREVALRYARGESHAAIAAALGLAPATVRNHVARCFRRLAVHSKIELARRLLAEFP